MLKHGSLFSGIGGFDLAAEWAGWENTFHCEWNEFGQKVLKHHFPKSISYADITKTDFSIHRGQIDIISGGFPCQPYSSAGKRLGKADERHLFPHMLRCIKEVKPRWVIGENVRGLVNWNEGMVFNEVYDDLEREGYEVQSFLIPAAGVNAPHQRYRIWFIAYSNGNGRPKNTKRESRENQENNEQSECLHDSRSTTNPNLHNDKREVGNINGEKERISEKYWQEYNTSREFSGTNISNATNTNKVRLPTEMENGELGRQFRFAKCYEQDMWHSFPTQSPICGGDDGIPKELDGITIPKWRNESIKAYGNAIVPQVAFQIFKAINEFERLNNS